jgi:hypothetical protein
MNMFLKQVKVFLSALALFCSNIYAQDDTVPHVKVTVIQEYSTPYLKCSVVDGGVSLKQHIFSANVVNNLNYKNIDHCRQRMLQQKKKPVLRMFHQPIASVSNNQMLCSFVLLQDFTPQIQVVFFEKQPEHFDTTLNACLFALHRSLLMEIENSIKPSVKA